MKNPIFVDEEYLYDYEFSEENKTHYLYYSNEGGWSVDTKGIVALSIRDTGDEYIFIPAIKRKTDYGTASQVAILMKIIYKNKIEIAEKREL